MLTYRYFFCAILVLESLDRVSRTLQKKGKMLVYSCLQLKHMHTSFLKLILNYTSPVRKIPDLEISCEMQYPNSAKNLLF